MMIVMPDWYGKFEERFDRLIIDTCTRNGIPFRLANHDKEIKKAMDMIRDKLYFYSQFEDVTMPKEAK